MKTRHKIIFTDFADFTRRKERNMKTKKSPETINTKYEPRRPAII